MVAYSFRRQFVAPIRTGLSSVALSFDPPPKRQTIRADRKRHARRGEELQLYCGMRTKGCFLIGKARCIDVVPIALTIRADHLVAVLGYSNFKVTDEFAQADGFADALAMHDFWIEQHGLGSKYGLFKGVIIKWEPL